VTNSHFFSKLLSFQGRTGKNAGTDCIRTGDEPFIAEAFSSLLPHCLLGSCSIPPQFSSESEEKPRKSFEGNQEGIRRKGHYFRRAAAGKKSCPILHMRDRAAFRK